MSPSKSILSSARPTFLIVLESSSNELCTHDLLLRDFLPKFLELKPAVEVCRCLLNLHVVATRVIFKSLTGEASHWRNQENTIWCLGSRGLQRISNEKAKLRLICVKTQCSENGTNGMVACAWNVESRPLFSPPIASCMQPLKF